MALKILCPDLQIVPNLYMIDKGAGLQWELGESLQSLSHNTVVAFLLEEPVPTSIPDYLVADSGCIVVSERLKSFFETCSDNLEFFRASIRAEDHQLTEKFYAVNITSLTDVLDFDQSEYDSLELDEDGIFITAIDRLVFRENSDSIAKISRLKYFSRLVIVDNELEKLFTQQGFTGVKFVVPEAWNKI